MLAGACTPQPAPAKTVEITSQPLVVAPINEADLRSATLTYNDDSTNDTFTLINGSARLGTLDGSLPRGYTFAAAAIGDLDGDGIPEGAIGLYKGFGANRITPLIFVLKRVNSALQQIGPVLPDPSNYNYETAIKNLSIDNNTLTVGILVLSDADKDLPHYQQQPSVPKAVSMKLVGSELVVQ